MNAADAVKLFAKQEITVNMPKLAKGATVRDKETGRAVTEDQPLAASHVVGLRENDGEVTITVADGRKYTSKAPK